MSELLGGMQKYFPDGVIDLTTRQIYDFFAKKKQKIELVARPVGMQVVSYTLKDITDDVGYLKALGEARTAEVQRDARIGQAEASMQARSVH